VLFVYPIGQILTTSVVDRGLTLANYRRALGDPIYLRVLWITVKISLLTTLVCLLLGYPMAYLMAEAPPRLRGTLVAVVAISFFMSLLVKNYAWTVLLQETGVVNTLLRRAHIVERPLPLMYNLFGVLVGMVPFTRIGAYAYIGGCSKIVADIPPFVLVDGNPAGAYAINVIGLRRAGMKPADRRLLQDAFRLLYRSGLATPRAVERIRQELPVTGPVAELLEFIAGSRRGICGPAQSGSTVGDVVPSAEGEPV